MPFRLPRTLNDVNEFGMNPIPFYVTGQEVSIVFTIAVMGYVGSYPVLEGNVFGMLTGLIFGIFGIFLVKGQKKKHPPGWPWFWDLRLASGLMSGTQGLYSRRFWEPKVIWFSMHHIPQPSLYLTGQSKPGGDLTVASPQQQGLAPLVAPSLLVPPRRRRVYQDKPSAAPSWFAHADGFKDTVNPTIPITVVWARVPEKSIDDRSGH